MEWHSLLGYEHPAKASIQTESRNLSIWDVVKEIPIFGGNLDLRVSVDHETSIHYEAKEESQ